MLKLNFINYDECHSSAYLALASFLSFFFFFFFLVADEIHFCISLLFVSFFIQKSNLKNKKIAIHIASNKTMEWINIHWATCNIPQGACDLKTFKL